MEKKNNNIFVSNNMSLMKHVNLSSIPEYRIHRRNFQNPDLSKASLFVTLQVPIQHEERISCIVGSDEEKKPIWGFQTTVEKKDTSEWKSTVTRFQFNIALHQAKKYFESPSWFLEIRDAILEEIKKIERKNENHS